MNDVCEELNLNFTHMDNITYDDFVHACMKCGVDPDEINLDEFNYIYKTNIIK